MNVFIHIYICISLLFTLPKCRTYCPMDLEPNARGLDTCRGSNRLWNRTLDRYTMTDHPKCVVSTMLGLPPRQHRTEHRQGHTSHGRLARWIKWRACDVGEAKEGLENEQWRRWSDGKVGECAELQPFRHFTYVRAHSPTLSSLYPCHSSFSNPSVASPTSQFILNPFFRFSYVTSSSLNSPGEPPMIPPVPG